MSDMLHHALRKIWTRTPNDILTRFGSTIYFTGARCGVPRRRVFNRTSEDMAVHMTNPHIAKKIETDHSKFFRPFDDFAESVGVLHGHERVEKIMNCLKHNMANALLQTMYVFDSDGDDRVCS